MNYCTQYCCISSEANRRKYYDLPLYSCRNSGLDNLHKFGIRYEIDLIIDNPEETCDDLLEMAYTLNAVPKPFRVHAYSLTPYPGTQIRARAESSGRLGDYCSNPLEPNPKGYLTEPFWRIVLETTPWLESRVISDALIGRPNAIESMTRFYREELPSCLSKWTAQHHIMEDA